jgi:hypothetical protein
MSSSQSPKFIVIITTFLMFVCVCVFAISIQSFAQSNPTNPGGGTTSTPSLTTPSTTTSSGQGTNTPSGITPVTPITPDINSEQIIEGTGTTIVNTQKAPSEVIPTAPIMGEKTLEKSTLQQNAVTTNETVRTGGLEIGLGLIALVALGIGYYYYKKKGDRKSTLKTSERKLRF